MQKLHFMSVRQLHDKTFESFISPTEIQDKIAAVAERLNIDYEGKSPLLVIVLNGAFMFAADLIKHCSFDLKTAFIRVSSYKGTSSTGDLKEVLGLDDEIVKNEDVIIVEDIVDTGLTIEYLHEYIKTLNPKSLKVASLLFKPDAYDKETNIDYIALSIPNKFVVGYGLDYNELGRNLPGIYVLKE